MDVHSHMQAQQEVFRSAARGSTGTTYAPLRANYVGAARCLTVVHLVSRTLAEVIEGSVIDPLRAMEPNHHWYPASDLHITIKNVRAPRPGQSFTRDQLTAASCAFSAASKYLEKNIFQVCEVRRFPTSIVIGAFATRNFDAAVKEMDRCLTVEGIPDDKHYASREIFFGAITLCRFFSSPTVAFVDAINSLNNIDLGTYVATGCELVECDEVCSASTRISHAVIVGEA